MNLTYDVIIKRTPYGLIASVPALDLRIIHNDKELNDCLMQHSAIPLKDFLELYSDTFLFTLSSRIEEEIYWLAKYLLDVEGYIPYPYTNVEHQSAAKEHCSIRITTAIERGKSPRVDLKIVKSLLKKIRIRHNPKLEHDPYNGYLKLRKLKRNRQPKQP
ncbi:hypothetical protein [Phascolarctobacterium succinatutens]|uniref:hypothetical protein n=1 Tax=Phascolarctobacterium succinatutens TaxID=626940 RepID=UPI003AABC266